MTTEQQDQVRDAACRSVADVIKPVCEVDKDDFNSAVLAAYMAKREQSSEEELAVVMRWANCLLTQATALHFFLIGVTECSVQNRDVVFRIESLDEAMRQLVRHGVAKLEDVSVTVPG